MNTLVIHDGTMVFEQLITIEKLLVTLEIVIEQMVQIMSYVTNVNHDTDGMIPYGIVIWDNMVHV